MVSSSTSPATSPVQGFRAWPRRVLAWPVLGYRLLLSPWLGSSCRFEPTCSRYALDALARHGAAAGSYLTAARILRCHPACAGGCDPVPAERPRLFRHLFPQASWPVEASPMAPGADAASAAPKPPALFVSQTSSSGPSS